MPKNQTRTLKVTYVEELLSKEGKFRYDLPLSFSAPIDRYSYNVGLYSKSSEINSNPSSAGHLSW